MNSDIRLCVGWNRHPKIVKLRRKLGADGVLGIVALWTFAGEQRTDGVLHGMDADDIAIAADYAGDSSAFVEVLTELRLLDRHGNDWEIHDWKANNPWAFGFQARSEKAKKAIQARWGRRNGTPPEPENGAKNTTSMESHTTSIEKHTQSYTPSPSPSPSPKEELLTEFVDFGKSTPATATVIKIDKTPYESILATYHAELPTLREVRKLTPTRQQYLRSAWRGDLLGSDLEKWRRYFAYVRDQCPFLTGAKPGKDGRAFVVDLEWLTKPANLVKVIEGKYEEAARHG